MFNKTQSCNMKQSINFPKKNLPILLLMIEMDSEIVFQTFENLLSKYVIS